MGPRYVMDPGIKPLDREWRICGPALTVRPERSDDVYMAQLAGKYVKPGDVVVIDAAGDDPAPPAWGRAWQTVSKKWVRRASWPTDTF